MKILFIISGLSGGGAEKLVNDLVPLMIKIYDCQVLILSRKNEKYLDALLNNGVKVFDVPEHIDNHIGKMLFISKFIRNGKFDIIHANLFPVVYYCAVLKRINRKSFPLLTMTEHNTSNRRRSKCYLRPLEKWIYNTFDHIISISNMTQENLVTWLKVSDRNRHRFSVVYNGIPIDKFLYSVPYERKDICSSLKPDDIVLCMIGSFTEQKNHIFMLEVLKRLPKKYKLLFVGEGPLEKNLQEQVHSNSLEKRIFFLGFRKDVSNIIKAVDIVVIPSKWEGFGLVSVEAMACEKPLVVSNVTGLSEVVADCAIKCRVDDPSDFINGILMLNEKAIYDKYVRLSLQRAAHFDIAIMLENYKFIFNNIIR